MIYQEMASKLPADLAGQVENICSYDICFYCQPARVAIEQTFIRTDMVSAPEINYGMPIYIHVNFLLSYSTRTIIYNYMAMIII